MREARFARPYSEPVLCGKRVYGALLKRMHDAGLIEYVDDERGIAQNVGAFPVLNQSGKLRLVIDARGSNFFFAGPDRVDLISPRATP